MRRTEKTKELHSLTRRFISEKLYKLWIVNNQENLTITQLGLINGKYELSFKEPKEPVWINDIYYNLDMYPIHR